MSKQIIEINGVKLEVDLSTAKRIDEFRVGDTVKVLIKETNYAGETDRIYPGVIVGFEAFASKPTIVVAYIDVTYSSVYIKYLYYNSDCKAEIIHAEFDEVPFVKSQVIDFLDREIAKKEEELAESKRKKAYFLNQFATSFAHVFK